MIRNDYKTIDKQAMSSNNKRHFISVGMGHCVLDRSGRNRSRLRPIHREATLMNCKFHVIVTYILCRLLVLAALVAKLYLIIWMPGYVLRVKM